MERLNQEVFVAGKPLGQTVTVDFMIEEIQIGIPTIDAATYSRINSAKPGVTIAGFIPVANVAVVHISFVAPIPVAILLTNCHRGLINPDTPRVDRRQARCK